MSATPATINLSQPIHCSHLTQFVPNFFYHAPGKNKKGGQTVFVGFNEQNQGRVKVQLCSTLGEIDGYLRAPFGLNKPMEGTPETDRKSMDVSIENDTLLQFLLALDQKNRDMAVANQALWFKGKKVDANMITNMCYKPLVTMPKATEKDPNKDLSKFKPTLKMKVVTSVQGGTRIYKLLEKRDNGDGTFTPIMVPCYKNGVDESQGYDYDLLEKENMKGCGVVPIADCRGLWFMSSGAVPQFGMTFQCTDILLVPRPPSQPGAFIVPGGSAVIADPRQLNQQQQQPAYPVEDTMLQMEDDGGIL